MTINLITFASLLHKQSSIRSSHEAILSELEKYFTVRFVNYEDIDKSLEIVSGYTRNFCTKLTDGYPTMELVKSFLAYFGLQEYLYIYKSNCLEMINYLKNHKTIDKYILK